MQVANFKLKFKIILAYKYQKNLIFYIILMILFYLMIKNKIKKFFNYFKVSYKIILILN